MRIGIAAATAGEIDGCLHARHIHRCNGHRGRAAEGLAHHDGTILGDFFPAAQIFKHRDGLRGTRGIGGWIVSVGASAGTLNIRSTRYAITDSRRHGDDETALGEPAGSIAVLRAAQILVTLRCGGATVIQDQRRIGLRRGIVIENRHHDLPGNFLAGSINHLRRDPTLILDDFGRCGH